MTEVFPSFGNTKYVVNHLADGLLVDEQTVAISDAAGIVTATWTTFMCTLDGLSYQVAAGSKALNAGDVATPTTYYVYFLISGGVPTAQVSTTNPCINPAITTSYFITNIVRFTANVGTSTVVYYISKYPTQNGVEELCHNLKEDSMYFPPQWISGIAPTFTKATGKLSTASGYVRFPGNEPRLQAAVTNGKFFLDDESAILTDLTTVITYSDTTAVSDTKWVKLLVGINRNKGGILDAEYMVVRQAKPGTEYASAAAAKADAEFKAAAGFGAEYLAACTPICYITGQVSTGTSTIDFTSGEVIDIRESGTTRGSGGGASVVSHGALANLNVVADHPGYVTLDGTRALTGDWDAGSNDIKAETFTSDIATVSGAPFTVTSTAVVTNLNADEVDGHDAAEFLHVDGSVTATGALNMGSKSITSANDVGCATVTASGLAKALTFESTQAAGTAPMVVASDTVVTSLNADKLDGNHAAAFATATHAANHITGGSDVVANAVAGGAAGLMTGADKTKLDSVSASADVTMTVLPTGVHALTAKSPVVDADELYIYDSVAAGSKKILASTVKTYIGIPSGSLKADGTVALTGNWDAGAKNITTTGAVSGDTLVSTVSVGTAPITTTSTTMCTNVNADQLDGLHGTGYLKADGSVNLAGNLAVDGTYTIDGVDISAHATNQDAHHARITLSDDLNNSLLQLNVQALDLDTQTASYAFMGPASGSAAAKPTFRAIVPKDIAHTEGVLTLVDGQNDNVTLTAGVDQYIVSGPTAAFGISGMTGGYAGRRVTIANPNITKAMTAYHQSTSSTAANRIICPGSMSDTATTSTGIMEFVYFGTTARWMLVSIIT